MLNGASCDGESGDLVRSDVHGLVYFEIMCAPADVEPRFRATNDEGTYSHFEFISYRNLNFGGQTSDQMEPKSDQKKLHNGDLLSPREIQINFSLPKETCRVEKLTSIKSHGGAEVHYDVSNV